MTINARMLITVLFLIGLTSLRAQNQRLTWIGDEYAMRYEVIIEQEEAGEYNNVLRKFTEESFIEVSLPSGKYRWQVIPYDFLNQPVPETEWMDFEVLSGNAHPGDETGQAETALTAPEPEKITKDKDRFDLYLSAAWIPLLPIHNESDFFGESTAISPYGAAVRFGFVSTKQRLLNPGMELTATWRLYTTDSGKNTQSMQFDGDMIQQFRFTDNKTILNFRLGAGVSLLGDSRWAAGQQHAGHINIGASLFRLILKNLFLETGMEYSQFFTNDFACFFRTSVGLGYRF
jgi:hypothetical protein